MIAQIIRTLQVNDFYGAGEYTEIAKGKREYITTYKAFKRKLKRTLKAK